MKKTDVDVQEQEATPSTSPDTFTKEAILKSRCWAFRRDALSFLLEDGKEYSHQEVENILNDYMKGQVK